MTNTKENNKIAEENWKQIAKETNFDATKETFMSDEYSYMDED